MVKQVTNLITVMQLLGCASSTLINSVPSGAKAYIDGRLVGQTPVTQKDTAIAGSSKTVVLKKDGFRDWTGTIRKEDLAVGPLVGGIFLFFPFVWILGYPDQYIFELEPLPPQPSSR